MEERIRFINHKGKQVLLVDVTNCTTEEMIKLARLVPKYLADETSGSVLLLADFTGSKFDKAAVESLKEAAVYDRPHLKRSAWVGTEGLPKIFYENLKAFTQRDLPTFKTREEGLDWLVEEDQIATGK
ncbi:MAG TPA: STAS/SEC14 domain-containing protein [Terriglobales bacterium]